MPNPKRQTHKSSRAKSDSSTTSKKTNNHAANIDGSNSPGEQDQSNKAYTNLQDSKSDHDNDLKEIENELVATNINTYQSTAHSLPDSLPENGGYDESKRAGLRNRQKMKKINSETCVGQPSNKVVVAQAHESRHNSKTSVEQPSNKDVVAQAQESRHNSKTSVSSNKDVVAQAHESKHNSKTSVEQPSNKDVVVAQAQESRHNSKTSVPSNDDVVVQARSSSSKTSVGQPSNRDVVAQAHKNGRSSNVIHSYYGVFICCGLVTLLFIIYFNVNHKDNRYGCPFNKTLALSRSRQLIKALKHHFPSQTEDTWKKLITLTWKVNQTCNPQWKKPLVYTLAHRAGALNTSRCLTRKILEAVQRQSIQLNAEGQYSVKHDINNALKHAFAKELNKALPSKGISIFNDLQSLNPELANQFRIYCDNTDAPYKQAVILFRVALDEIYDDALLSSSEIYIENKVTKVLRKSWPLMRESSFDSLAVRILQNIVIINVEEHLDGC